jgi:hypothetical protein
LIERLCPIRVATQDIDKLSNDMCHNFAMLSELEQDVIVADVPWGGYAYKF